MSSVETFVGVDQALRKIGVAIVQDRELVLTRLIVPPAELEATARLQYLREALTHTLQPFKHVTGAAMEGQSYNSRGQIDQLGRIAGIVEVLLADHCQQPPLIIPPTTLKKFVSGRGLADKSMMIRATTECWGLTLTQDDICDAHGLARIAEEFHIPRSTLRHQVEAVQTLRRKSKRKRVKRLFPTTI